MSLQGASNIRAPWGGHMTNLSPPGIVWCKVLCGPRFPPYGLCSCLPSHVEHNFPTISIWLAHARGSQILASMLSRRRGLTTPSVSHSTTWVLSISPADTHVGCWPGCTLVYILAQGQPHSIFRALANVTCLSVAWPNPHFSPSQSRFCFRPCSCLSLILHGRGRVEEYGNSTGFESEGSTFESWLQCY